MNLKSNIVDDIYCPLDACSVPNLWLQGVTPRDKIETIAQEEHFRNKWDGIFKEKVEGSQLYRGLEIKK